MDCQEVANLLDWFYDDELAADRRALVAKHLAGCRDCARALAGLQELDRISRQLSAPEPQPGLWDRVEARMAVGADGKVLNPPALWRRRLVLAAGVLAVYILAAAATYWITRRQASPSASDVASESGPVVDPVALNLALLGPDDRRLAELQRTCAAGGCDDRLGAEGRPIKLVLNGQTVFCCCKECAQWAQSHPDLAIAKAHMLEEQHKSNKP